MLNIIPQPQLIRKKDGIFSGKAIRTCSLCMPREDGRIGRHIRKIWQDVCLQTETGSGTSLSVNNYTEVVDKETIQILSEHDDSYYLSLDESGAYVFALCAPGLFYGIQTLRQICEDNGEVQCCEIIDYADVKIRASCFDLRQTFPLFENLLSYIGMMAGFKSNALMIEYEDKFPFEKHSCLKHRKYAFTKEQLGLILDTARENFIQVIPLQQSFGHLEYVLRDERYRHLRETPWDLGELCPCNPESLKLVCGLIDELAAGHPDSRYLHLGCDEVWSLGSCGLCREKYGEDKGRLFVDFVNRLINHVCSLGKKPVIWHDMLAHCGEGEIARLDSRVCVMVWLYGSTGLHKTAAPLTELLRKYGIEVFGACSVRCNDGHDLQNHPKIEARLRNIDAWAGEAQTLGIPFVAATNWAAGFSMGAPYGIYETSIYPMYACGEKLWKKESRSDTFLERFLRVFHGINGIPEGEGDCGREDYYELLAQIGDRAGKHKDIAAFMGIVSKFGGLSVGMDAAGACLYRGRMFPEDACELVSLEKRFRKNAAGFLAFKTELKASLEQFLPRDMADMYIEARYFVPEYLYHEIYEKHLADCAGKPEECGKDGKDESAEIIL